MTNGGESFEAGADIVKEFCNLRTEIEVERHVPELRIREESGVVNRLAFLFLLLALFGLTSCHHSTPASTAVTCTTTSSSSTTSSSITCTDPVTSISLTIAPATVSLNVVGTQQFNRGLSGGTNNIVTWKATVGTIDASGLYNAPATVPSTNPVSVTATSVEDPKLSATAMVTILPAPVLTITSPTPPVKVTSGTAVANQVTFTATETGGQSTDVIYWCAGPVGGPAIYGPDPSLGLGTIDATGVYTPPLTPPIGSEVIVTAAISKNCSNSATSVPVTISGYSTSSLNGQFAFSMAGANASGHFFRAGSFAADGSGNLTGGLEDINDASGVTATPISFAGSYTLSADGRGTLTLNDGRGPAPSNASNFRFVLVNATEMQIIGFDATGTASGQATAQNFSTFVGDPLSALTGTYVFDFSGFHGANTLSQVGEFTADGAGHITGGSIDINDGGTSTPFQIVGSAAIPGNPCATFTPSTYSINPNGRGTAVLATNDPSFCALTFSFYVVSRGSAKFVGTDTTQTVAGYSVDQVSGVTLDKSYLNGNYAFLLGNSNGTYVSAGSFFADGLGTITGGALDENSNGTPNANVTLSANTYQVGSNGRGTLSLTGGRTYVFYLGPIGTAIFQETDSTHASDGMFAVQQNTSFAKSQIAGNYAIATTGLSSGTTAETLAGEFAADGMGGVTRGTVDDNAGGTTHSGVAITTGSYAASSSAERGTLALTLASPLSQTRNYAAYVVSSTQVFVVGIDSGPLAAGELLRQF